MIRVSTVSEAMMLEFMKGAQVHVLQDGEVVTLCTQSLAHRTKNSTEGHKHCSCSYQQSSTATTTTDTLASVSSLS
jgi:hypothetical protein